MNSTTHTGVTTGFAFQGKLGTPVALTAPKPAPQVKTVERLVHRTTGATVTSKARKYDNRGGRHYADHKDDNVYTIERDHRRGDRTHCDSTGRTLGPKVVAPSTVDVVTYSITPDPNARGAWIFTELHRTPLVTK